jgi:carbonic anhydrase
VHDRVFLWGGNIMSCHHLDQSRRSSPSRRAFVQIAALGGGASLLLAAAPSRAAGHCDVLLLTCMDYRLQNEIADWMAKRGLRDNYDHVILAGAALGAVTDQRPAWNTTFADHLGAAIQLHGIKKVIVLDHRDCGAYRLLLGDAAVKDAQTELATHTAVLHKLRDAIAKAQPKLEIELGIMALDGSVETVA